MDRLNAAGKASASWSPRRYGTYLLTTATKTEVAVTTAGGVVGAAGGAALGVLGAKKGATAGGAVGAFCGGPFGAAALGAAGAVAGGGAGLIVGSYLSTSYHTWIDGTLDNRVGLDGV